MSLFGKKASSKSNSPRGGMASYLPNPTNPSISSDPATNNARQVEGLKGKLLHNQLKKSKSTGIKLGRRK